MLLEIILVFVMAEMTEAVSLYFSTSVHFWSFSWTDWTENAKIGPQVISPVISAVATSEPAQIVSNIAF